MARTIEVFSAGCAMCTETIDLAKTLAGSTHDVHVREMQSPEVVVHAKALGIRSLPAVLIDGRVAGCCAGRGPYEQILREALRGTT